MSLPVPQTGRPAPYPSNMTPQQQDAFDAPLIALAQKSNGDLRNLLYMFFSFLHRRTDFYCVPNDTDVKEGVSLKMGFREGDAEKLMLAAFRQFPLRRMPRQGGGGGKAGAAAASPSKGGASADRHAAAPAKGRAGDLKPSYGTATKVEKSSQTKGGPASGSNPKGADVPSDQGVDGKKKSAAARVAEPMGDIRRTKDGKQVPEGNGGVTPRYRWTQTIDEASVVVAVPEGTRGKDLAVTLKAASVSVRFKTKGETAGDERQPPPPILEGDLTERIYPDESTWTLEGGALLLTLDKVKKTWWDAVLKGDDKIDTSLIDSKRKIAEYDESTQGAIRKIIFDQNQEQLGLPTSDEIMGTKPKIPPLPPGVEYIDKSTFEKDK